MASAVTGLSRSSEGCVKNMSMFLDLDTNEIMYDKM